MSEDALELDLEGKRLKARSGDTVAAALLREGVRVFSRGPKYHRPRGPFCFTGDCAQCHMRIGGEPNVPACLTPVSEGLRVERQNVLGSAETDLLRAVDFLYPEGIDHHHLMTHFKVLNDATKAIARRLAGIGELPSHVQLSRPARTSRHRFVVIGAGPAGLSAALTASRAGLAPLVLDGDAQVGGRAAHGFSADEATTPDVLGSWQREIANVGEIVLNTRVVGLYDEGGEHIVVARDGKGLWQIAAERVVLASGCRERPMPFEGNDLPGVFAGRGLIRFMRASAVIPGKRAVVVGSHRDTVTVARGLRTAGIDVAAIIDPDNTLADEKGLERVAGARPLGATGRTQVRGLRIELNGREQLIKCDVIATVSAPVPAYELAAEVGAAAKYAREAGGFVVAEGPVPGADWLQVAGSVTGASDSVASGRRVGSSLAERSLVQVS